MKVCPQCQHECADETIVCPNCGYLFNAARHPVDGEQPMYQQAGAYNEYPAGSEPRKDGLATPAMVLGIVGVVLSACLIGAIPAIIGLIFGIIAALRIRRTHAKGQGQAIAGIVLSAVAIAIVTFAIVRIVLVFSNPVSRNEFYQQYDKIIEQYQDSAS